MTHAEIVEKVTLALAPYQVDAAQPITLETRLDTDLKFSSLDMIEFCLVVGTDFDVSLEPDEIQPPTVGRVADLVMMRRFGSQG